MTFVTHCKRVAGRPALAILNAAVNAVATNIQTLYFAGARRLVVVNGPDVGLVPAVRLTGNPAIITGATLLSAAYNAGLAAAVTALSAGLPGIHIGLVDLFGFLDDVVADPGQYGLTNVTDMCITPGVRATRNAATPMTTCSGMASTRQAPGTPFSRT